ncbi:hypothetical protein O6D23_02900 [Legionella pneumophila]|uniref:hypothetical protein n=1 Tax=Legionella pneumophila TaxID=446 RepID=UPI0022B32AAD|nr:hypothetical protein [Legionella pneumophila]MCZ4786703.1 hypothetical protein [Legionella pneumophila]
MAQHYITSVILNSYEARILFNYYLPENNVNWQDRYHGSIDIKEVFIHDSRKKFDELPVIECIHIRRACWDYLETNDLYLTSQVIPLSLYLPVKNQIL